MSLRDRRGEVRQYIWDAVLGSSATSAVLLCLNGSGILNAISRVTLKSGPENAGDVIRLEQIEVLAHIGVPDDERAQPQRLTISLTFWPVKSGDELNEDITCAVNYAEVCAVTRTLVQDRRDRLIETLAGAVAQHLLGIFEIKRIIVEVRKFVLPEVEFVSVTVTRDRATS
ncbi:MAG: 7,8-dihydroneopterin aldolase/epimerase/oxygenase [Verrucomicrobiota bacterium]|jgi:dihydroneopterin aldolase